MASGDYSTANGYRAGASGDYSTANGVGSVASGTSSVALGTASRATHANEVNIGIWSVQPNLSYKQTDTRTLSGLADGVNADEAVNKKQLDDAINNLPVGVTEQQAQQMADTAKAEAITAANQNTAAEIGKLDIDTKLATVDTNAKGYASAAKTEA
ncbi:hypothetical protein CB021_013265, partial [Salmonella enterica]|nr:hypothetical protein [Salmonella enterica]